MRLTLETDYAIRIVDYLAKEKNITRSREISEKSNVPLRFAKNILQKLTRKKIVTSYKGAYGGYILGKNAEDISLYDVIEATNDYIEINRCHLKGKGCPCMTEEGCPYYKIFTEASVDLENRLRKARFGTLVYGLQRVEERRKSS